ncbi:uncharacterized protein K444DRAFT_621068 [Hyaloscypha bicolor E]|uniref:Uncharacterized protein n=1 Tax=Hyaloscypha bicolor E TaxID=1095630 RepID=A0A2J6SME5_9HELO|nr:uncharacterized protein K444DRAFT_621068 [Hyaloscypha bicolor E]PMD51941.1 hypothetical protein K444DRAFT_621068 [Hyaloscypha bicolor E]
MLVSNFQLSLMNLVLHVMRHSFKSQFILGTVRLALSLHPYRRPVSGWHWYLDERRMPRGKLDRTSKFELGYCSGSLLVGASLSWPTTGFASVKLHPNTVDSRLAKYNQQVASHLKPPFQGPMTEGSFTATGMASPCKPVWAPVDLIAHPPFLKSLLLRRNSIEARWPGSKRVWCRLFAFPPSAPHRAPLSAPLPSFHYCIVHSVL